jgi:phosphoglycerol transferase MdoB-like AlkP superfamily enzyme
LLVFLVYLLISIGINILIILQWKVRISIFLVYVLRLLFQLNGKVLILILKFINEKLLIVDLLFKDMSLFSGQVFNEVVDLTQIHQGRYLLSKVLALCHLNGWKRRDESSQLSVYCLYSRDEVLIFNS